MRNAFAAIKFLTALDHFNADPFAPERIGKGVFYFPLVGLTLGLTLALLNRFLEPHLESEILGVALITILIFLTGASHLEQTRQVFDGSRKNHTQRQADAKIHLYGFLAVMLIVLFKIRSVEVIGELRKVGLILAPTLARWALVIFFYGAGKTMDDSARRIAENVRAWHLFFTTAVTLTLTIFLVGIKGLWIALCVSLIALLFRSYLDRFGKELTTAHFGMVIEFCETLSFVLFASL